MRVQLTCCPGETGIGRKKGVCVDTTELETSSSSPKCSSLDEADVVLCTCLGVEVAAPPAFVLVFCLNGLSLCGGGGRSVAVGFGCFGLAVVLPLLIFLLMAAISSFLKPSFGSAAVGVEVVGFRWGPNGTGLDVVEVVVPSVAAVDAVTLCVVRDLMVALSLGFGDVLVVAAVRGVLDLGVDGRSLGPAVVGLCDGVDGLGVVTVVVDLCVDDGVDEVAVVVELSSVRFVVVEDGCCFGRILSLFLRRRSRSSPGARALGAGSDALEEDLTRPDGI